MSYKSRVKNTEPISADRTNRQQLSFFAAFMSPEAAGVKPSAINPTKSENNLEGKNACKVNMDINAQFSNWLVPHLANLTCRESSQGLHLLERRKAWTQSLVARGLA